MPRPPSAPDLRRRRLVAQRLHRPSAATVGALVRDLLAVQAQDQHAAALALRARAPALTLTDVVDARRHGTVVITWLMRGTLHLVAVEDLGPLHTLTAERGAIGGERRLRQLGVADAADDAVAVIEDAVAGGVPVSRPDIVRRLAKAGIPADGQAPVHLIALAARRRVCVLGVDAAGGPAYVPWPAQARAPVDRAGALAELARRYLRAHGPATEDDLATWSGLPLRDVRAGLASIADGVTELGGGLLDVARPDTPEPVGPRLLPAFDPYLLGWRDRTFAVGAHGADVAPGGGVIRATVTVDGVAVATWRTQRSGDTLRVALDLFHPLRAADTAALWADAQDVARFERRRLVSPAGP
ncbi:MAG TPA: winged helix DNA-binding domain-containing protein [Streptosporangiales bacterium]